MLPIPILFVCMLYLYLYCMYVFTYTYIECMYVTYIWSNRKTFRTNKFSIFALEGGSFIWFTVPLPLYWLYVYRTAHNLQYVVTQKLRRYIKWFWSFKVRFPRLKKLIISQGYKIKYFPRDKKLIICPVCKYIYYSYNQKTVELKKYVVTK